MKKINYFLIAILLVLFLGQVWADTGATTTRGFLYKPPIGARRQTEKNAFDAGLDRVDVRLGKEIWAGDPAIAAALGDQVEYASTLSAALTAIGSTPCTLHAPRGNYTLSSNTTIPANVILKPERGAVFIVPTGKTLTLNGALEAGPWQIFSCAGTGKVVIGDNAQIDHIYPEWWGALGNAWYLNGTSWYADSAHTIPAHDDSAALQAAVNCVNDAYKRKPQIDLNGHYLLNSEVVITGQYSGPYFHGSGGGSQYGFDYSSSDAVCINGPAIINGGSGYALKIELQTRPFFDNLFFYGGVTDAPGTGSVRIVDRAGGQGFRNCTFVKGHAGVCFQEAPGMEGQFPYGIYFDRCRFLNYMDYAPTYDADWITSVSQDRPAALRFENGASMTFYSCDFNGWPSFFYGNYAIDGKGHIGNLVFYDCYLQSCTMQAIYTAGYALNISFYKGYFESATGCLPWPGRSYFNTGGTDSRLAVIDVNSANVGSTTITLDHVDVGSGVEADSDGNRGRTFLLAQGCDLDVRGGNINTRQRPFARLYGPRHVSLIGSQISTSMTGSFPVSSGDAFNVFNGTANYYSPVQGNLASGNYCASVDARFGQRPTWMTRTTIDPSTYPMISRGPLVIDGAIQMGHYNQNTWNFDYYDSPADLGADSMRGDIIWNMGGQAGARIGRYCTDPGSAHGGSGSGSWVNFGQVGYRSGSGSPSGSVTPNFIGEEYFDTGGHWYKATGLTNTSWVILG